MTPSFIDQIRELVRANGWEDQLMIEEWGTPSQPVIRVRLSAAHPSAPSELVNDYQEGISSLEQVQQECLRAIRTGRPGL